MSSSDKKNIQYFLRKIKNSFSWFLYSRSSGRLNQVDIDKKLVYSLSPQKIPSKKQFKYLGRFLSKKESLVLKICAVIILVTVVYLALVIRDRHFSPRPAFGGVYVEGLSSLPKLINPIYALSRETDNDISRLVFSQLFAYNTQAQLEPDLVTDYSISDDGLEYLIKIREGVKWHGDNGELTSDDVSFTFNLIKDEQFNSPLRTRFNEVSLEKVDDYTVKFILVEPYGPFLELLNFGILPAKLWSEAKPEAATLNEYNIKPIGSGPFQFKSLVKSKNGEIREYQLEANNDYYKAKPYLKNIIFRIFPDQISALSAFNENNIEGIFNIGITARNDVSKKESSNFNNLLKPQTVALFFNLNKEKLSDLEIRKALALGIDKEELVNRIYSHYYQVANSPLLESNYAYKADLDKLDYNPDLAKEYLSDRELSLEIVTVASNGNQEVAESVKNYWQELGLEVSVKVVAPENMATVISEKDYDVLLYGQQVGGDPDVYSFWYSGTSKEKTLNFSLYKNETVDKLLAEARASHNQEDRQEKYFQFQTIINQDIPAIFLYNPSYIYLQNKKIKGFTGTTLINPADRFNQVETWYIKTKRTWKKS